MDEPRRRRSLYHNFNLQYLVLQNLNNLLENYLEPLKRETFLSNAEINALFGNIQEIVTFQRQFLQNLDHAIEMEADFNSFDHPSQFKVRYYDRSRSRNDLRSFPIFITGCSVFHWKCLLILRKSLQAVQLVLRQPLEGPKSFTSK